MKEVGLMSAISMVYRYKKLTPQQQRELQQQRLQQLVTYARDKSPYFKKLYHDIPSDFQLKDLPPTNKLEMMEAFDRWVTASDISLEEIQSFMQNTDNIGRYFKEKYFVFTTSGSTGNPSVVLYDRTANNITSAINLLRAIARPQDLRRLLKKGFKSAGVYATGGFYLGYSAIRSRLLKSPYKKSKLMAASILEPLPEIVKKLNSFQPAMLGGYPTALELLMEEQKRGSLDISPALIMTGGEYLSPELRQGLSEAFSCYVQTSYSCTEGGTIACECPHQHFHINEDWIIVEPVDKDNNPVADGVQSHKLLLTNLANFTQPFIRFEITDRVILHREPCPCGSSAPWLELEGRTDDILTFKGLDREIRIVPLALYALLKEQHAILRFQLIAHPGNRLELRLVCREGVSREAAFIKASEALRSYLNANEIGDVEIYLSDETPQPHPKSGKFKHVYKQESDNIS